VEGQADTLVALTDVFTSTRRGAQTAARRARFVAVLALLVAGVILFIRTSPGLTSGRILTEITFDWFTLGLLGVLGILIITVLVQSRQISSELEGQSQVQQSLQRRWEEPQRIARARET
jgi:hypothetical protein